MENLKIHKGCTQLKRWPSTIDKAVRSLKALNMPIINPGSASSGPGTSGGESTVTASLMKSVMALKTQTQGEKILCNVQSACMEIGALLQVRIKHCAMFFYPHIRVQGCWDFTE